MHLDLISTHQLASAPRDRYGIQLRILTLRAVSETDAQSPFVFELDPDSGLFVDLAAGVLHVVPQKSHFAPYVEHALKYCVSVKQISNDAAAYVMYVRQGNTVLHVSLDVHGCTNGRPHVLLAIPGREKMRFFEAYISDDVLGRLAEAQQ